jgi:methylaspartate mutase sigma subunit
MLVDTHPLASTPASCTTVVLASIPSDSHMWNLVFLEMLLAEAGHVVINLGPCTPLELVVDTAIQNQADAVVISSVNGHAHLDAPAIAAAVRADSRCAGLTLIIGGKLGVRGEANIGHVPSLIAAGFDEVFESGATPPANQRKELLRLLSLKRPIRVGIEASHRKELAA